MLWSPLDSSLSDYPCTGIIFSDWSLANEHDH